MGLVISVTEGSIIHLGPDITLTIGHKGGKWMKLVIDAPQEIRITRETQTEGVKKLCVAE